MDTTVIASPSEAFAYAADKPSSIARWWKWLTALFHSNPRKEKLARLLAQYRTLPLHIPAEKTNARAAATIDHIRHKTRSRQPTCTEIAEVEHALLSMLPGEDLKRYAWVLRTEFQRAVEAIPADQVLLKAYRDSKPPEVDTPDEARLRADLLTVHAQLQELYATRKTQIRARNRIACWTTLLSSLAIFVTLQLDKVLHIGDTIAFDVLGVGMLGGVFSTLLRIQRFKLGGNCEAVALTQPGNQAQVILSPIIGGFGAVLFFVMLAAGVLSGTLFPKLETVSFGVFSDALEDLFKIHIASSTDAAKLYFWCFVAGFSERLVPDVIARLASAAERQK